MDNIKNTPLVSVILPNYNNDKYLDKSMEFDNCTNIYKLGVVYN